MFFIKRIYFKVSNPAVPAEDKKKGKKSLIYRKVF